MTFLPDQRPRTSPPADADEESLDEVIVLEPTMVAEAETEASTSETGVDRSLSFGASRELTALLQSRLRAAAGFIAIVYLVFLGFAYANPGTGYDLMGPSFALRVLLGGAVFALLSFQMQFSYRQLRWLEYLFFGLLALLLLVGQYQSQFELIEQGNLVSRVAIGKNGILRMWMLMMIYGVFIPNHPKKTAQMVLPMLAGSLIVIAIVLNRFIEVGDAEAYQTVTLNAGSNILYLVCGASLAIYSAYLLNGLRTELHEARQLSQYRLLKKLDAGGMGEVYLAEHQLLKRPCAIKLINPDLEKNSIAIARFEREVHATAMLSHPNTIEIFDYGVADDGTFYYVMEFLPGLSLADMIRQAGPMPPERTVYLMIQVCGSLAEAHRMGLVHRDLKPANIFVAILGGQCDVAKVLDFGLVKQDQPSDGRQLTMDYTVSGTPTYMSPEQAKGKRDIDGRADLYSLGAVMYYVLTGHPPFERDSAMSLMVAQVTEAVRPLRELAPGVPADLEAVVMRCLAKSPADRYEDASVLRDALAACRCAANWNQPQAEQWWLSQAVALESAAVVPEPATT